MRLLLAALAEAWAPDLWPDGPPGAEDPMAPNEGFPLPGAPTAAAASAPTAPPSSGPRECYG